MIENLKITLLSAITKINDNDEIQNPNSSIQRNSSQNVIDKEKEDRHRFNILLIILFIFLIPSLLYFSFQMFKNFEIA